MVGGEVHEDEAGGVGEEDGAGQDGGPGGELHVVPLLVAGVHLEKEEDWLVAKRLANQEGTPENTSPIIFSVNLPN